MSALWNYTVGDSMANGSSRIALGWVLAIIFFGISVLMFATISSEDTSVGRDSDGDGVDDGCDEDPFDPWYDTDQCEYGRDTSIEAGSCCCVLGILSLLIVQSGTKAKKNTPQLIYIPQVQQPAPQQVIHHHTTHTYAPQPVQTPVQPIVNPNPAPIQQAIQDIKQHKQQCNSCNYFLYARIDFINPVFLSNSIISTTSNITELLFKCISISLKVIIDSNEEPS